MSPINTTGLEHSWIQWTRQIEELKVRKLTFTRMRLLKLWLHKKDLYWPISREPN